MKVKKIGKRLTLNKKTVVQLDGDQQGEVRGGGYTQYFTCGATICNTFVTCQFSDCRKC